MSACNVNEKEVCVYAHRAADNAVRKTFAILGVDIDEPEQVKQFQQDLRFGSFLRRAAEKGMLALVVAAFVGVGSLIVAGFLHSFGGVK
jgi:hypothetical protein